MPTCKLHTFQDIVEKPDSHYPQYQGAGYTKKNTSQSVFFRI